MRHPVKSKHTERSRHLSLLKKIKAEKDALIKAGKIKKDKHESFIFKSDDNCYHENIDGEVTDITEKIPFDLPEGWAWSRLYSITSFFASREISQIYG